MRPEIPIRTALLLLAGGLAACSTESDGESGTPLAQEIRMREATRVRVAPVVQQEMVQTISTTTEIESEKEILVLPRTAGQVVELRVEEGDRVAAGEVLCVIDNREAASALADAEIALVEAKETKPKLGLAADEAGERAARAKLTAEQAERKVQRNEEAGLLSDLDLDELRLNRDTAQSDWRAAVVAHEKAKAEFESSQTAIDRAQIAVDRAELMLSYTEVTAPFAGVIAERNVRVGDWVSNGEQAFVLTDIDHVRAIFYRPQVELEFFRRSLVAAVDNGSGGGDHGPIEISIHPEAIPGEAFEGRVAIVSPTIDPNSGSFRITIALDQPTDEAGLPRLLPGMLVRLDVVTDRHREALVLPKRALRREGDAHFVFRVHEDTAHRVAVREGFSTDDEVEVLPIEPGSLGVGDSVVVVGNRDLEDGDEVKAEPWDLRPKETGEPEAPAVADTEDADAPEESDPPDGTETTGADPDEETPGAESSPDGEGSG